MSEPMSDFEMLIAMLDEERRARAFIRLEGTDYDRVRAEVSRLEARVDELLAANTAEVERRRKAEEKCGLLGRLMRDNGWDSDSVRTALVAMGFDRPDDQGAADSRERILGKFGEEGED